VNYTILKLPSTGLYFEGIVQKKDIAILSLKLLSLITVSLTLELDDPEYRCQNSLKYWNFCII
jgi:hypothetical protein